MKLKTIASLLVLTLLSNAQQGSDETSDTAGFLTWQDSPNTRGTMDIIWTCLFTVFICVWTAVHLNVPAPPETDTTFDLWVRRIKWVGNCCAIPEIVMMIAAGQWSFARACWREMRDILFELDQSYELEGADRLKVNPDAITVAGVDSPYSSSQKEEVSEIQPEDRTRPKLRRSETFEERQKRERDERWTLRHAFFANMGGFRLRDNCRDRDNSALHIITAKHINFLVRKRYIPLPTITTLQINDRSKSDSLAKFLAIMQVGWLAIQVIARAIQKLETTSLEITTLSFVVCTLGSFVAWYRKPYDVQTFLVLDMDRPIDEIELNYTDMKGEYRDLLEEYKQTHPKTDVLDEYKNIKAPYTKLTIIDDGEPTFTKAFTDPYGRFWGRKGPKDPNRIRNDRLPVMEKQVTIVVAFITFAYAALHVAAWNIPLATSIEQLLWRISAIIMIVCCIVWFFMDHFEEYLQHKKAKRGEWDGVVVPWWRVPASIVVTLAYGVSRLYVLVESFVALRLMPASAYEQVDWGRWVPHI